MIRVNRYSDEHFDKTRSTSHKNLNVNFEWVNDGSGEVSIFIDRHIPRMLEIDDGKPKFGWLLESRTIIPEMFEWAELNSFSLSQNCVGIFTCDFKLSKRPPFIYTLSNAASWITDKKIYEKTKLVSMISSSKAWAEGHRNRLKFVELYKDRVDLFGNGFRDIEDKITGLKDYMFSIAVENCKYDDYFTEKITDCFATGTVPIYWGTKKISKYFDPNGIIFLDDDFDINSLSEELYMSKMDSIKHNFETAKSLTTAEDFMYKNYFLKNGNHSDNISF
jgi:hypothetical protein